MNEGELTLPLKQLNTDCRFKQFYEEWCDNLEGKKHLQKINCSICKKEFNPKTINQTICFRKKCRKVYREANKDRLKAYREANKDKIKAYYEANKDKIKDYYEANKDKIAKRMHNYYLKKKESHLKLNRLAV